MCVAAIKVVGVLTDRSTYLTYVQGANDTFAFRAKDTSFFRPHVIFVWFLETTVMLLGITGADLVKPSGGGYRDVVVLLFR